MHNKRDRHCNYNGQYISYDGLVKKLRLMKVPDHVREAEKYLIPEEEEFYELSESSVKDEKSE